MLFHTISSLAVRLTFIVSVSLSFMHPAGAVIFDDLYVAEVLVPDESAAELRRGARAGLLQVLVRVSGTPEVEDSSLVRASLRNPAAYYYQFSYEASDKSLVRGSDSVQAQILRIHFEPSAIARLLRDASLPVWGSNRPAVLLWVALSDGQDRRIISEADTDAFVEALKDQARQRGIPLLFPILDIEDTSRISTAEVWGSFLDRVESASIRYNPDGILTARVQQEMNGRWSASWSFSVGGSWQSLESVAFSRGDLVRGIVDQVADNLADRFALGASRSSVNLVVDNVATLAQYAALSGYLEQLAPVLNSSIVSLEDGQAEFQLQIEGQYSQLLEIIELDERLVLLGGQAGERLTYRWLE